MIEQLSALIALLPFEWAANPFFQRALIALVIMAPLTAVVSVHVVNYRLAFFGDTLSHSAFTGVALGVLLGLNPQLTLIAFALLVAIAMTAARKRTGLALDTIIGVFYSFIVAVGIALVSSNRGMVRDFNSYIYGDILAIAAPELVWLSVLTVVVVATTFLRTNDFLSASIDEDLASTHGVRFRLQRYLLHILVALVVAVGIRAVGLILVTAMLVVPAASARNIAATARSMFWWALLFTTVANVAGLHLAIESGASAGATIVLTACLLFVVTFLVRQHRQGWLFVLVIVAVWLSALTLPAPVDAADANSALTASESQRARQLLDRIDDMWRGKSSVSLIEMEIKTKHWRRSLVVKSYTLGKDYSLVRIVRPKKEAGISTLKVKEQIWNYLPKVDRPIKIPPSMMMSSWMGSHFTNDDLVKESRMADDYTFAITYEGQRDGRQVIEITLNPRPEAAVVWGKVVAVVDTKLGLPVRQEFFDEKMKLARYATFTKVKTVGGRMMYTEMLMKPLDKPKEYTKIRVGDIRFDVGLKRPFFSEKTLKRR